MSDRMGEQVARNAEARSSVPLAQAQLADRLRQTQQDLAASQADLTRAERERDEADARWEQAFDRLTAERDEAKAMARRWSDRYAEACRAGHVIQAELASARTELEQLRAQLAAHPDGGDRP